LPNLSQSQQARHEHYDILKDGRFLYHGRNSALAFDNLASGVHDKGCALALKHAAKVATSTIQDSTSQIKLFDQRPAGVGGGCPQDPSPFGLKRRGQGLTNDPLALNDKDDSIREGSLSHDVLLTGLQ